MRRNYLKGRDGDRINAVLAAAGYNFSLLLRWFEERLRVLLLIICRSRAPRLCLASLAPGNILHGRPKTSISRSAPGVIKQHLDLLLRPPAPPSVR